MKTLLISFNLILFFSKNLKSNNVNLSKFSLLLGYSLVYDLSGDMILNKMLSLAASIIKLFIFFLLFSNSNAVENNIKYFPGDMGTLSLMYHRFNENKYPSTNIDMKVFANQIKIIQDSNYDFYNPKEFDNEFEIPKVKKKFLITIDDAFSSFYDHAWPFLKKNKIPFILFVSTQHVNNYGYMTWDQIKEIEKENFAFIGNHSHSHEYMINFSFDEYKNDIDQSINIFKEKLGYNPIFFSYPFGEYSLKQKKYIKGKFKYAFGQHSGVIDLNKDRFELPRFPINEKYGDLERFKFLIKLLPMQYKLLEPEDKLIFEENNPPNIKISFFKNQKNIKQINCFSNDGGNWNKTKINFSENSMLLKIQNKFLDRRGRINCSLNDADGWRWFGIQFIIKKN